MKISFNWLKQYINLDQSPHQVSELLTDIGLEVESLTEYQSIKGGLQGIVIGEVLQKDKHPNADRLSVCKVNVGNAEPKQIVCGAGNVEAGQKVVVALPGARLFPTTGEPFEIKKSKIRGEHSEGMICAEDEIGLGTSHDGIMVLNADAQVGKPASEYFSIENDWIFEIGLTPNRADAVSHIGVARDLKAVLSLKQNVVLVKPTVENFKNVSTTCPVSVEIKDKISCPRYSGLYIDQLIVKESPTWLQNKLRAVGLRPINNIVDVTNYVMVETGQPLHAFDAAKIKGNKILVQQLTSGTIFKTLDGADRKLNGTELMICDEEGGMCMAGVFGGIESGVSESTTAIFLESAWFNPVSVRKTARAHSLHTDSSFRFERGTDPEGTIYALKRAAILLEEVAGGKVASSVVDIYDKVAQPAKIKLEFDYAEKLIGEKLPAPIIKTILQNLEIIIEKETGEYLELVVPAFKVDVTRPADIIEEILRVYGYNAINLPGKINSSIPVFDKYDASALQRKISAYLVSAGFNEILNNSLSAKANYTETKIEENLVRVLNPLSNDLNVLRAQMIYSGLETIIYNQNRKQERFSLFEFGKTYLRKEKNFEETNHLSIWCSGKRYDENYQKVNLPFDIFYLKSIVRNSVLQSGWDTDNLSLKEGNDPIFDSEFVYEFNGKELIRFGLVSKTTTRKFDLTQTVYYADINVDVLVALQKEKKLLIKDAPRFPEVRRDLSMVLDRTIKYEQLTQLAYQTESKLLKRINLFDVFEGEKIGNDKKSYALSFTLSDEEQTLQDVQIDKVMNKLMDAFEKKLGAIIRKQ